MNMAQTTQEKRSIKVKDFLQDFRGNMGDEDLMQKYQLTPVGLEKFYTMLLDRGILVSEDFDDRYKSEFSGAADNVPTDLYETDETGENRGSHAAPLETATSAGQARPAAPTELPVDSPHEDDFFADDAISSGDQQDQGPAPFEAVHQVFGDSADEIVSAMPLDYADEGPGADQDSAAKCGSCTDQLYPGVRKIYDNKRSILAIIASVVCLVAGFLGAASLTFFEGYSFARLVLIYFTGISILLGCVMVAVGLFMLFFARERVYACLSCGRVYPRL